jgi:hypothetical protein
LWGNTIDTFCFCKFFYKRSLNANKSTGVDEIPARFIKDGGNVIKVPITAIINQSITTGVVPQSMKYARVKPLFKKNETEPFTHQRKVQNIGNKIS